MLTKNGILKRKFGILARKSGRNRRESSAGELEVGKDIKTNSGATRTEWRFYARGGSVGIRRNNL